MCQAARKLTTKVLVTWKLMSFYLNCSCFRVPELEEICVKRCENELLDCILGWGDSVDCLSACIRLETECIEGKFEYDIHYVE